MFLAYPRLLFICSLLPFISFIINDRGCAGETNSMIVKLKVKVAQDTFL